MEKAIVTGASGFIGKNLVKYLLNKGFYVLAIVRNKDNMKDILSFSNLKIFEADLNEYKILDTKIKENSFNVFFHVAWAGVDKSSFYNYEQQIDNIKYTCDALILARKLKCKKFIFIGSFVEYEVRKYIEEDTKDLRIATTYGMSKLTREIFLKTLVNQYNDINLNIIYPAQVYGEGDKSKTLSRILIESFIRNKCPKLVEGNFLYDWIYIKDLIEGIIAVYYRGKNKKGYYIGHRKIKLFKDFIIEIKNIIAPDIILKFGEYPDNANIDYSKINLDDLYNDTGFEIKSNFKQTIKNTELWIRKNI